jgi:hypothetical protein
MVGPLGGGVRDMGTSTINTKKHRWRVPLGGADGDLRASTINIKNSDDRPPWEALPEIRELPQSTLRNIDNEPQTHVVGGGPVSIRDLKGVS